MCKEAMREAAPKTVRTFDDHRAVAAPSEARQSVSPARTVPLAGIFGTGRCGSTWVGAIIDSHPDVAYRFEPVHRGFDHGVVEEIVERLVARNPQANDLQMLHRKLLTATAAVSKPPFFRKRAQLTIGRDLLWPVARRWQRADMLYRRIYTPRTMPLVVFKEVALEWLMQPLIDAGRVPVIYVLRHPCGVVASQLRGQQTRLMPTARFRVLPELMRVHDPALAARYAGSAEAWSPVQKNAMLWRLDCEKGVSAATRSPDSVHMLNYEELCLHPEARSRGMLAFLGLDWNEQTARFLERSSGGEHARQGLSGRFINKYFSVFRDPRTSMNAWKTTLSREQVREIISLVEDSPAYHVGLASGAWQPIGQ